MEEWRKIPIEAYSHYSVSNLGNLRRDTAMNRRAFRGHADKKGYIRDALRGFGGILHKCRHQVVALAFIGPPPSGYDVNHKDGKKLNNSSDNLEYVTRAENIAHSISTGLKSSVHWTKKHGTSRLPRGDAHWSRRNPELVTRGSRFWAAKLTEESVSAIRKECADGIPPKQIAKKYGITNKNVWAIFHRHTWKHVA